MEHPPLRFIYPAVQLLLVPPARVVGYLGPGMLLSGPLSAKPAERLHTM